MCVLSSLHETAHVIATDRTSECKHWHSGPVLGLYGSYLIHVCLFLFSVRIFIRLTNEVACVCDLAQHSTAVEERRREEMKKKTITNEWQKLRRPTTSGKEKTFT